MGVPVKFFKGSISSSLPSSFVGGGIYFIPQKGIYTAQGSAEGYYPGNEYYCYANYTSGIRAYPFSSSSGAKIYTIAWHSSDGSWNTAEYKSIGYLVQGPAGTTWYGTPQIIKNSSGALVLACYTQSGFVLATNPTTKVTHSGYYEQIEIKTI